MTPSHPLTPLLDRQRRALGRHLPPAVDGAVEPLHQCRVSTRRLRELLRLTEAGPSGRIATRACRRVRRVGRTLGAVRELDVALALLGELAQAGRVLPAAAGRIRQRIREERDRQRRRVRGRLDEPTRRKVERAVADAVTAVGDGSDDGWRQALARQTGRRAAGLRQMLAEAGPLYVSERVHAVRIAAKKLRYVLEIATDTGESDGAAAVSRLKATQQTLGRLHDLEVLQSLMRSIELPTEPHQRWVGQVQALDEDLEAECRRLHGRFVTSQPALLQVCDEARELASPPSPRRSVEPAGGRTLKMSLDGRPDRAVARPR